MPTKPNSSYYNPHTKELQDGMPASDYQALCQELRTTRYYLQKARAENATLKRELKRIRGLAKKMLESDSI